VVPAHGRNYFDWNDKRSDLPSPAVIAGTMPAIKSMADGRIYETRRNYEKSVARAGCSVVGFDKRWQEHVKPASAYDSDKAHEADVVADVKRAIQEEASKMPPAGGLEDRRLMRKQRRQARAST
jgi:hypothetical protein